MKKHMSYSWKGVLFTFVVIMMLSSATQTFGRAADAQDVTLSATVRDSAGNTGTIAFTFELEEMPAASAVLPDYSTIAPQPSAVPEPSTLVLVGLGVLGLAAWRKRWSQQ